MKAYIRIAAEIEFGNPKLDCDRFGICSISTPDDVTKLPMRYGTGLGFFTLLNEETISLTLIRDSLSDETIAHHFSTNTLLIEEDMNPTIATIFGDNWQNLSFKAGLYPFDTDWHTTIAIYRQLGAPKAENQSQNRHQVAKNACKCHAKAA